MENTPTFPSVSIDCGGKLSYIGKSNGRATLMALNVYLVKGCWDLEKYIKQAFGKKLLMTVIVTEPLESDSTITIILETFFGDQKHLLDNELVLTTVAEHLNRALEINENTDMHSDR